MRRRSSAGFTLIEITAATLLFFIVVTFALQATTDSVDQSLSAERARRLSMMAGLKLGEIEVFERYHDYPPSAPTDFDNLPEDLAAEYEGWQWESLIEDFTFFGRQKDPNAPYFFEEDASDAEEDTSASGGSTGPGSGAQNSKGDTQILRRVVLKVTTPSEDGDGDSIEIVTFLPQVARQTSTGTGTGTGTGDGK